MKPFLKMNTSFGPCNFCLWSLSKALDAYVLHAAHACPFIFPSSRREEVSKTNFSADTRGGRWWLPWKLLSPRSFCRPSLGRCPQARGDSRWPLTEDHDHKVALLPVVWLVKKGQGCSSTLRFPDIYLHPAFYTLTLHGFLFYKMFGLDFVY